MAVKPKLCMIPSGYKGGASSGDLYSVLPSDGTGDFDFSRSGSATRINKDGLIETVASNVPRLNYPLIDGVVSGCPSLLLEPERRNLIQYSEDFSNWSKENLTLTSNVAISPDGTLNASKITENGTNTYHALSIITNISTGNNTVSVFAKKDERRYLILRSNLSGSNVNTTFDLENGVITYDGHTSSSIESFSNGWYRCVITSSTSSTSVSTAFLMSEINVTDNTLITYQGDGTSGLYIWGAQLEQSSFPTSYIPNYGTALGVTRSAETCNNAGDVNTFNDSEGVLFAEISALADDGTYRQLGITNFPSNNYQVNISLEANSNKLAGVILSNNVYYVLDYEVQDTKTKNKVALKYKVNDLAFYVNGFKVSTINTAPISTGLNVLKFSAGNNVVPFYGNTKQIQYFDTALTDSDLEELTSWTSFNEMAQAQLYTIL